MRRSLEFLSAVLLAVTAFPALAQGPSGPVPVIAAEAQEKAYFDEVEALGTLRANESVELTSTVTELVTAVNFEDGQRVNKGEVLVQMDDAEEQAERAEEVSRYNEAKRQVERLEPLIARGAASKSSLDEWRREMQTAQARLNAIDSRISKRQIVAPFDGVVGLRNISVGALAQPGTMVATIDDDSIMKLDFSVPELFLKAFEPGVTVSAVARAFPESDFTGEVSGVDSRVDPVTRSLLVRAKIPNEERLLKPGMLMTVSLKTEPRQTLVVPEEAIIANANEKFVMAVRDHDGQTKVERQVVELGTRRRGEVEILSGLQAGEKVVTHGTLKLRSGQEVNITAVEQGNEMLHDMLETKPAAGGEGESQE